MNNNLGPVVKPQDNSGKKTGIGIPVYIFNTVLCISLLLDMYQQHLTAIHSLPTYYQQLLLLI